MAAPAVAASAALVRQYFTSGYYPSGEANERDARTPSGRAPAPSSHLVGPRRQNMPPPLTWLVHIDRISARRLSP
eukprot:2675226-Pyramimonas_sp.AAC.1